ncbi:class E sortase [Streptomyces orinoci]|uniref:Class E sortase n=1 Tax=Streptomyces orinoci TaxID=67339 RepID=A0ABV3K603_STRON|nr:class E sortase [Streptomyces orinoci]
MRLLVRTLSELCLTVGLLTVLLVVYLLYWTGVRADGAMRGELDRLHRQWSAGPAAGRPDPGHDGSGDSASDAPGAEPGSNTRPSQSGSAGSRSVPAAQPPPPPSAYRSGAPFAVMYIPRLGAHWAKPVLQGTGTALLKKGLGHYPGTAPLGAVGNFAVAGHRRTYGDPFKDLPRLRPGDAVVLTDGTSWFTYRVDTPPYRTLPDDTTVLDPVPAEAGRTRPGRYLTLTTCDPEWGHSHRLIVWGHLDEVSPASGGKPKALPG